MTGPPSTVVLAPDSFKGSASATEAAAALAAGWLSVRPGDTVLRMPMADGGEGTLDVVASAVPGATRMAVTVTGPDDRPVEAHWLRLPDGTGLVELAATSGLTLLDRLRPLTAHTTGFGQAIAAAIEAGADRLLLAIGGSASTDGGAGALMALGARVTDAAGHPVPPGGGGLARASAVDLSGLRALPPGGATVLGDVTNPLLGPSGAAAVFGPQKGATAADVALLDTALGAFARLVAATGLRVSGADPDPAAAGAGAAGGTGFGLAAWGAGTRSGAVAVGETIGLAEAVARASVVVTGEGRFDSQTDAGKVPAHVAALARAAGVPVSLVAGSIEADPAGFASAVDLTALAGGRRAAIADAPAHLVRAGAELARRHRLSARS